MAADGLPPAPGRVGYTGTDRSTPIDSVDTPAVLKLQETEAEAEEVDRIEDLPCTRMTSRCNANEVRVVVYRRCNAA